MCRLRTACSGTAEKSWAFSCRLCSLALGLGFGLPGRDHKRQINVWEGALFMVLVWPLLSVLGMMPYVLSGRPDESCRRVLRERGRHHDDGFRALDYAQRHGAEPRPLAQHHELARRPQLHHHPVDRPAAGQRLFRPDAVGAPEHFFQSCLEQDGLESARVRLRCLHCADGAFCLCSTCWPGSTPSRP